MLSPVTKKQNKVTESRVTLTDCLNSQGKARYVFYKKLQFN